MTYVWIDLETMAEVEVDSRLSFSERNVPA